MISCSCCCWTELEHFRKCVRGLSTGISQNTHKSLFSSISILLFSFLWADCFAFLSLALFSFISVILCLGFVMCRHQICRQYNTIGWHSFSVVCRRRCRHRRRVFISFLIGSMWWVCLLFTICYWKCIDSVFSSSHFFAHFFSQSFLCLSFAFSMQTNRLHLLNLFVLWFFLSSIWFCCLNEWHPNRIWFSEYLTKNQNLIAFHVSVGFSVCFPCEDLRRH